MSFETCPTDVVRAQRARVWELLTKPELFPLWADSRVAEAPARPVAAGDRIVLKTGPAHAATVIWDVVAMQPCEELTIDVRLPFGLVNHEVIRLGRISDGECRVTFN